MNKIGRYLKLTTSIRAVAYTAGIYLVFSSIVQAQDLHMAGVSGEVDTDLVKWGVTQGGLVFVTLVILWSYRKDFKTVLAEAYSQNAILAQLIKENTAAKSAQAETLRELTRVIDNLRSDR